MTATSTTTSHEVDVNGGPATRIDEIADGVYRISTYIPDIAPPAGFTFNEFLVVGEEALLFHTGPRQLFPLVTEAVRKVLPPEDVRWITFGHVESDECGSMNEWLGLAPQAQVAANEMACLVSLNDLADRPPVVLAEDEVLDLGGKRMRMIPTPHVPHNWEAQVFFEETTGTMLCGDLFTSVGNDKVIEYDDPVGRAVETEDMFQASSLSASTGATIRRIAALDPTTLAVMHGPSFSGDCAAALHALADEYDHRARAVLDAGEAAKPLWPGCPELATG